VTVICGGFTLNGSGKVTLEPGIYVLRGGELSLSGSKSLVGDGVSIVLTRNDANEYAAAKITGNASAHLTAPVSGPMKGFVFFQDRTGPAEESTFTGSSDSTFDGALYFPSQTLTFHGSTDATSGCIQVIADKVRFSGSSDVAFNCKKFGLADIGGRTSALRE
jgi:hypothetical protein